MERLPSDQDYEYVIRVRQPAGEAGKWDLTEAYCELGYHLFNDRASEAEYNNAVAALRGWKFRVI